MVSPVVICDGVIRSGSTWSYNVCRLLGQLHAQRRGQPCGMACQGAQSLDRFLRVGAKLGNGPAIIKVHEIGPTAIEWIASGRAKAVCTFRDLRDCVASDMVFWGRGFEASVKRVMISIKALDSAFGDSGRTLLVRYEDMISDRLGQIGRIADYLNIELNQTELEEVDSQSNIQSSRALCRSMANCADDETDRVEGNHMRHRVTLLHDNHIGNARIGKWKDELSGEQGRILTQAFGQALRVMGYTDGLAMVIPGTAAWSETGCVQRRAQS
jgi:hypothetical protein